MSKKNKSKLVGLCTILQPTKQLWQCATTTAAAAAAAARVGERMEETAVEAKCIRTPPPAKENDWGE
jgi:hypothetical protein